jgi:hypothetical protein
MRRQVRLVSLALSYAPPGIRGVARTAPGNGLRKPLDRGRAAGVGLGCIETKYFGVSFEDVSPTEVEIGRILTP